MYINLRTRSDNQLRSPIISEPVCMAPTEKFMKFQLSDVQNLMYKGCLLDMSDDLEMVPQYPRSLTVFIKTSPSKRGVSW